ncbi:MAG: hypothetical protein HFH62_00180 [Lachnospiraceae bacterium]|nr:hypothetical protein [Lachnospiraceae bacterium]
MKSFMKKAAAALLVLALCLTGMPFQNQKAGAAESNVITVIDTRTESVAPYATAGQPVSRSMTLSSAGDLTMGVYAPVKCNFTYQISQSNGTVVFGPKTVTAMDPLWTSTTNGLPLYLISISNVTVGTFQFTLTFSDSTEFDLVGLLLPKAKVTPSLDTKSIIVTKGFKDKVNVLNGGGAKFTYTSSNSKVASVDASGNVTGKKKGSANVTVKNGNTVVGTCKVTVKDNVYNPGKLSISKATRGLVTSNVYQVSYDKKGNLIVKVRLINRFGRVAKKLKNYKVTVYNEKGKTIGTYTLKSKTINLKNGKAKSLTCKIKKSKLKIKKVQDLRNMSRSPKSSGKFLWSR